LPYLHKFQKIAPALIAHYNTPFWIPAGTNKDDLECPIDLKVRKVDGTLVAGFGFDHMHIAIGGGGGWAGRPSPLSMWAADALFLCGS